MQEARNHRGFLRFDPFHGFPSRVQRTTALLSQCDDNEPETSMGKRASNGLAMVP